MERKENCSSENALYYARILFVWFCLLGQVGHVVAKRLKVEVETPGTLPELVGKKAKYKVTDLTLDVHLMIDRPVRYAERFCQAGADIVTVHVEADTQENTLEALRIIRACGKKPAICVKPKTPAEAVLPFIGLVDLILVMTVEPGFGGQSFMADMMPKVQAIRAYIDEKNPGCELEVDGGVNAQTAKLCTAAGANVLVAGSAFFKAEDKAAFVQAVK